MRLSHRVRDAFRAAFVSIALLVLPALGMAAPYAAYVMDARTGEVLYETNANTRLHPASLTKMMTLYIAFEAIERGEISLDTKVRISEHAAAQAPSRLGLKPGQRIALRYLIRAAAIKSANDAATAIGEAISGSESKFAARMNRTAKALGMTRTTFRNANGLTAEGHLSTARDMTILGRHLFYDYPQYYGLFSRRTADAGVATVTSTNRRFLDSYKGADGIKTGYTVPAGFNLTASAQRGNKHIIATIFGGKSSASRNAKMAELLDLGFRKAPNKASEQPPSPPVYVADAGEDAAAEAMAGDPVAAAVARAVGEDLTGNGTGKGVAAGKTIRVATAVTTSPRPRPRPSRPAAEPAADAVAVASLVDPTLRPATPETGAAAATEEAVALALAAEAAGPAGAGTGPAAAAGPEETPLAAAPAPAAPASPAPAEPVTQVAAAEPATEGVAGTDAAVLLAMQEDFGDETAVAAADPAAAPAAAEPPAVAAIALARVPPPRPAALAPAPAVEVAAATGTAADSTLAAVSEPVPQAAVAPAPATDEIVLAAAVPEPPPPAAAPQPDPDEIVLADVAPLPAADQPLEVVTRVSTSGGRNWAISVGNYPSRYEAERILLQTALIEMTTLEEALRKVVARRGGFDALFVGMTQETAELACARLAARAAECAVISPAG